MADLISRESLIAECKQLSGIDWNKKAAPVSWADAYEEFIDNIEEAPAVDAVEVVRCKDCKWLYNEMDDYCCRSHRGLVRICENSYCSYGERKEDG